MNYLAPLAHDMLRDAIAPALAFSHVSKSFAHEGRATPVVGAAWRLAIVAMMVFCRCFARRVKRWRS